MKLSRIFSVIVLIMVCPFLLPGCNSSGVETLPTLSSPHMPLPDSSARGRLIIDDGCIRLRSLFPTYGFAIGSSTLLIWPHGYAAGVIDGKTVVLDEKGEVVANVGMTVFVGGGNVSREIIEANIEHPLPEACHGPYWVVSSVKAE